MTQALAVALLAPVFAGTLAVSVLVPLFVGTVWVLHLLREREGPRDVERSVLLAAAIWMVVWLGVRTIP